MKGRFHPLAVDDTYDSAHGHYPHKLFGYSHIDIIKLTVDAKHPSTQKFWIKWRISCEDGGVPKAGGHAKIHFTRVKDAFAAYHPDPNGDQDAVPEEVIDQGVEK